MYEIIYTGQFKRSLKKCVKRGLEIKVFTDALDILQEKGCLPLEYKATIIPERKRKDYCL